MKSKEILKSANRLHALLLALILLCPLPMAAQGQKLVGTPMGSPSIDYGTGAVSTTVNQPANAFDGDLNTFYASYGRSRTWVGLDLGKPHVITRVGWCPRNHSVGPDRVRLALFEGANRADFMDAVPLYLVPASGTVGKMEYAPVNVSRGFRYVRYVGPNDARCNVAEVAFYGISDAGDDSQFYQVTNLPTVSIHTASGNDPQDKVNDLEASLVITYDQGRRIQESPITTRLRGNASMGFEKKPYRIKFNDGKSHRVLEGSPLESPAKAKKWTLINNYGDKALMRNILAFELSRRVGMPYTVYCQAVDVLMNGEYKGCYQLCDQITVDPHRVPITEMEPADVSGPELSGGYLIEVDAYAGGETSWFKSNRGNPVTVHSPDEDDIVAAQTNYIRSYFNQMETALFATNYKDPETGYRKYLDVESFVRYHIVGEFAGNTDTYWSTYMYKERGEQTFTVGPCWDFDLAFDNDYRTYPVNDYSDWIFRSGGSNAGKMKDFVSRILSDEYAVGRMESVWQQVRDQDLLSEGSLLAFVDSMADYLRASATLNFTRWPILNKKVHGNVFALGSYQAEVNLVRDYLKERLVWFDEMLHYRSGLYPDSVFQIASADDLVLFSQLVNDRKIPNTTDAVLTADIDMAGVENFVPIGLYADQSSDYQKKRTYQGTIDGQGHIISNLTIRETNFHEAGLVSRLQNGTIKNLGIVGAHISSNNAWGRTAPFAGWKSNGTIVNCFSVGEITLEQTAGGNNYGGIYGGGNGLIENCYTTYATLYGYNEGAIVNSYPAATASSLQCGELCFWLNQDLAEPVYFQTLGQDAYPVLAAGHKTVFASADQYCDGSFKSTPKYTNTPSGQRDAHRFEEGICAVCNAYDPDQIIDGVYQIATPRQLCWFSSAINEKRLPNTTCAALTADIDLEGLSFVPIGLYGDSAPNRISYLGTLDGRGHVISNLTINDTQKHEVGLVSRLAGTIQNLGIVDAQCTTTNQYGRGSTFCGWKAGGTLLNCFSYGVSISLRGGTSTIGGAGGLFSGGSGLTLNCYTNFASLFGFDEGTVTNSYAATEDQLASGETCHTINQGAGENIFFQTLGEDLYPVLDPTHMIVLKADNGTFYNAATGINEMTTDNSQQTTVIYDLQGRRVTNPLRGIYIINGRKVNLP